MTTQTSIGALVALVGAAFLVGWAVMPKPDEPKRSLRKEARDTAAPRAQLDEAERQLGEERAWRQALEEELATLRKTEAPEAADATEAAPEDARGGAGDAPPTEEEIRTEIRAFGDQLRGLILGTEDAKEAARRLREMLQRAGPEIVRKIIDKFQDEAEDMGTRVLLAHVLAQSELPDALEALKSHLRDPDAGILLHRFASHALAFSDAEGLDPFLSEVAHKVADYGARANAAFGLNRRGVEEGIQLYFAATDEAFQASDPAALQYLGGLALMGERAFPGVRERLLTYENKQALLLLIHVAKSNGDRGAIPALEKLAYDSARPVSVQKAAEGALTALAKDAP
ncbi:MAG: hypothetical protein ACYTEZ_11825 [Planctomycetota bacterium]|jgi:hypothetical protein